MKKEKLSNNIEFSSTRAFEVKNCSPVCESDIDWASQTLMRDQTRAISSNNNQKKVNITVYKNVKGW
ncbi:MULTISPECIES: hypothetical protein [Bacteroides]|uniref:hypothetical protein n=1 Tax=Bacteroides TaxID=816 RepID=UPI001CDD8979|nr:MULTISPECIES: hypothetical protein [Bacteroides]MCA4454654.1 hypothetical protein [Bacteroides xylanisolvens]MCA4459591.1 hypothetical protein [Bacteroides xylanisolvens]MCA4473184.1 hypothetical protein [Bacteroides xylanisolvens]MCA4482199.1 hypothetical protein [Bacteroides xylanisolvens]MCA4527116.1 hypothetical protein [Bacteroides ovatus]